MEELRTEEEQIEALKKWWNENGKSLLLGVVLAVVAVYGYKGWQNHQRSVGEAASGAYFELLDAVKASAANTFVSGGDAADRATVTHLAQTLKKEHEDSAYALYAALLLAQQAVLNNDLALAETELQWVVDHTEKGDAVHLIARLRLARVIADSGETADIDRALALIEDQQAGSHAASYEEVKGDFYLALGRQQDARTAYEKAMEEVTRQGQNKPLLTIKLDDLAVDGDS